LVLDVRHFDEISASVEMISVKGVGLGGLITTQASPAIILHSTSKGLATSKTFRGFKVLGALGEQYLLEHFVCRRRNDQTVRCGRWGRKVALPLGGCRLTDVCNPEYAFHTFLLTMTPIPRYTAGR
jgi:hypothetical protein